MKAELTASGFEIEIDFSRCGNCGVCVAVCPENVLHLGTVMLSADNDECTGCNCCIITCPADALLLIEQSGENDG
ncbi:MAG: 4Fe-4S binding protein [candidate division Zixibacteria bacterium]|nr:4Fe-4S binding protein [candidate division Zixibacteria bacterium]